MPDHRAVGLTVVIVAVVAARMVSERNLNTLSATAKVRLLDAFSSTRKFSLFPLVAVVLVALALPNVMKSTVFLPALSAYVIVLAIYGSEKLNRLELPSAYVRMYWFSQLIQIAGLLFFTGVEFGWFALESA